MTAHAGQPQQERSRATRLRLLEAAVACLAEKGWTGSTVAVVAERAGVTRGAAQYHFRTREDLIAAAVEYVTESRLAAVAERSAELPPHGADRTAAVVWMVVDMCTGPYFRAALHLWVTASTEETLRAQLQPMEARVGRTIHRTVVRLLGVDERVPGVRETIQGTLDMARGLGLAAVLGDDSARREPIVRQWVRILQSVLGQA